MVILTVGEGNKEPLKCDIASSDCTVAELKELAKEKEIKGYSNMNKEELLEVLAGD